MTHKLELNDGRILNLKLSKGQKSALRCCWRWRKSAILFCWMSGPPIRSAFPPRVLSGTAAVNAGNGKTIFAISHDDHYFIHADRLLEMRNGQLTELTGDERDAASRDAVARTA